MDLTNYDKLVAILFCDIKGYTALMHKDGQKALATVNHFQNLLENQVKQYQGTVSNFYGDGALCLFPTPKLAVQCAILLQEQFLQDPVCPVRMGIHSGSVTIEQNKVFGDSVNIASRIENLGVPNTILISKKIRDEIKNDPEIEMTSLGIFELKNLDDPIEIFAIVHEGLHIPSHHELAGKIKPPRLLVFKNPRAIALSFIIMLGLVMVFWQLVSKNSKHSSAEDHKIPSSIAIFPFSMNPKDVDLQYIGDGISENLIKRISHQSDLRVISRHSAFALRDSLHNLSFLQKILAVDAILVGNIYTEDTLLHCHAELISTADQARIWGEQVSGTIHEIMDIETQILDPVVSTLSEQSAVDEAGIKVMPEAYKHYMQGRYLSFGVTQEEIDLSVNHFHKAIEIDPNFALAYAALANQKFAQARFSNTTRRELIREAKLAASHAVRLAPNLAEAHLAEANILFYCDFDWGSAGLSFQKALKQDPNNPLINADFAFFQCAMNNYAQAIELAEKAILLDPVSISSMHIIGWAHLYTNPEKSIKEFNNIIELHPNWIWGYMKKGMAEVLSGNCRAAMKSFEEVEKRKGAWGGELLETYLSILYHKCGEENLAESKKHFVLDHIQKNGISDPLNIALLYAGCGDREMMLGYARKCIEQQSVNVALMQLVKDLDFFNNDPFATPKYRDMLRALNFPNN